MFHQVFRQDQVQTFQHRPFKRGYPNIYVAITMNRQAYVFRQQVCSGMVDRALPIIAHKPFRQSGVRGREQVNDLVSHAEVVGRTVRGYSRKRADMDRQFQLSLQTVNGAKPLNVFRGSLEGGTAKRHYPSAADIALGKLWGDVQRAKPCGCRHRFR